MRSKKYYIREMWFWRRAATYLVLVLVGTLLNFNVMMNNNGKMPVYFEYNYTSAGHFSFQNKSEVPYWYLSDVIPIYIGKISIGDIFIISGIFLYIWIFVGYVKSIRRLKNERRLKEDAKKS